MPRPWLGNAVLPEAAASTARPPTHCVDPKHDICLSPINQCHKIPRSSLVVVTMTMRCLPNTVLMNEEAIGAPGSSQVNCLLKEWITKAQGQGSTSQALFFSLAVNRCS